MENIVVSGYSDSILEEIYLLLIDLMKNQKVSLRTLDLPRVMHVLSKRINIRWTNIQEILQSIE